MKISDNIEKFILDIMGKDNSCDICRNELASYFMCAPSQINYVIATRFTLERGFRVESRRGGGGFIRIEKFNAGVEPYLNDILLSLDEPVSYTRARQIVLHMAEEKIISDTEGAILLSCISEKALSAPSNIADIIRRNILKETIVQLLKR